MLDSAHSSRAKAIIQQALAPLRKAGQSKLFRSVIMVGAPEQAADKYNETGLACPREAEIEFGQSERLAAGRPARLGMAKIIGSTSGS